MPSFDRPDTKCGCVCRERQIDQVYGREQYTALVGAPGQAAVYVFDYNATEGLWEEIQVQNEPSRILERLVNQRDGDCRRLVFNSSIE